MTITLDDDTHRAARVAAAERGLSLSGLVRTLLRALQPAQGQREAALRQAFAAMDVVEDFVAGNRLTREQLHER